MKYRIFFCMIILLTLAVLGVEQCKTPSEQKPAGASGENAYVGSPTCTSCHPQENKDWLHSHHYKAMLPANDSTILGNFNNVSFSADGVTSKFFKKENKFFINTQGEDGKYRDYEVKYTFGFTPLQQYLIEFPGGRMQATRVSWDDKKKKWYNQYAGEKIPHGDWLHWTGNGQNWNTMCASCHSTNLQKGYDENSDTYKTTYNEINVSCESCHGPGKSHIDYINGTAYKTGQHIKGSLLHLTKTTTQTEQVNACGYCHARRADITGAVLAGPEFMQDFIPELPTTEFFYADGQMKDEDYNYTSFLQSKMFHKGVECTNCHNPHSNQLKLKGDLVCSQCHGTAEHNTPLHTMHAENSAGSSCISCHMPSKIYMGIDLRHDHSFRIPRPDLTVQYGTPNTCNSCHQDKSPEWAAQAIAKHFGPSRRYHFAEDLIPGSRLDKSSTAHLLKLLRDTATPQIIRATAVNYIGKMNGTANTATLIESLQDSSAMVRFFAVQALANTPPSEWIQAAWPLLQDSVRAVRIASADLFCNVPENQIPANYLPVFYNAKGELAKYISYQTDFAQGNVKAGDFFSRTNNLPAAEKFYRRAVAKDDKLAIARINLASTLNANGKNEEALQQLLIAQRLAPGNDHIYYSLGLLYVEMNQMKKAEESLAKAVSLKSQNERVYYNYALLLQKSDKPAEAEKIYRKGLEVNPSSSDLLYALTVLYLQQNNIVRARETAIELKKHSGDRPEFQELFKKLQISNE